MQDLCILPPLMKDLMQERAASNKTLLWPHGSTIRIKFLDGQPWQVAWVKKVVEEQIQPIVAPKLLLQFVPSDEYADVKITFEFVGYGTSTVGRTCIDVPQDEATMALGNIDAPFSRQFVYSGTVYAVPVTYAQAVDINGNGAIILHEFGHVFGLFHEHQNPINNPIVWDIPKTLEHYKKNYNLSEHDIYLNIIDRLSPDLFAGTPYDSASIMGYAIDKSLTLNGVGSNRNFVYSANDRNWLANLSTMDATLTPRSATKPWLNLLVVVGVVLLATVFSMSVLVIFFS